MWRYGNDCQQSWLIKGVLFTSILLSTSNIILMPAFNGESRRLRHKFVPSSAGSMSGIFEISPEQLRAYITTAEAPDENSDPRTPRLLLLDCRSFVSYNIGHIVDAVNVHCPAILRRRSGGHLPLRTVIPNGTVRSMVTKGHCYPIVLYDDMGLSTKKCSTLSDVIGEESTLAFVARCIQTDEGVKSIYFLEGGYHNFSRLYPELCAVSSVASSPQVPTTAASVACSGPAVLTCPVRLTPRSRETEGGPVQILPHLYLGSACHASSKATLQQLGITALLNVSQNCPNHFQDVFLYKCIPVQDTGSEDIGAWFQDAFHFIDEVKSSNGKVLVHCRAGISRSATICIAYLMAKKRLRMEEAYEYVKSRRRVVSPNFNFMGQLLSFENQVFSSAASANSSTSAPPSPLLAAVASTPDPDSMTPSHSAQQHRHCVFDFALPVASPVGDTGQLALSPCVM